MTPTRPGPRLTRAVLASAAAILAVATLHPSASAQDDLDAFMKKVLERRDDNWQKLREYVLDEKETLDIRGPGYVPLQGFRREFTWYVRDGILVRSPVKYDGVRLSDEERRRYEDEWLRDEQSREDSRRKLRSVTVNPAGSVSVTVTPADPQPPPGTSAPDEARLRSFEPRFVSEAYFMDLPYEPGNYYVAGRESFEGREVVRVEYYPTHWFDDEKDPEDDPGEKIARQMHKTVMVTLWIVPDEHQIVKFRFDNVGFDFLPFRWLARVTDARASMVMGQPFPGVWLPREMSVQGAVTLANGTFAIRYAREYYDYRQADVKSRIRVKDPGAR